MTPTCALLATMTTAADASHTAEYAMRALAGDVWKNAAFVERWPARHARRYVQIAKGCYVRTV